MAKSKGKTVGLGNLRFNRIDPYGQNLPAGEGDREIQASTLHIDHIRPDPEQPRRLLPHDLAESFFGGELSPGATLQAWFQRAREEDAAPVLVKAVEKLRQLADTIARQGLINPITVREAEAALPARAKYLIVTGERRWWAHVLLALENRPIREGNLTHTPDRIKAFVTAEGVAVRAHQLIENIMREDIGLIEKADGIIALREELSRMAHGDQAGEPERVNWEVVDNALGVSRHYRYRTLKVLDLCEAAQNIVDWYGLTERAVRPVAAKLKAYPDLQVQALNQLVAWQQAEEQGEGSGRRITASMRQLVDQLLREATKPKSRRKPRTARTKARRVQDLRAKVRQTLRYVDQLDQKTLKQISQEIHANADYADVVADLRALRERIDVLLESE